MVCWVEVGMEVVDGKHARQSQGVIRMKGGCRGISRVRGDTPMTPNHTAVQVRSAGQGRTGIGQSSWKGLSTARHEKAPVRCPCSRLTTLHDAPRTPGIQVASDSVGRPNKLPTTGTSWLTAPANGRGSGGVAAHPLSTGEEAVV